jgi:hypothetical protein
LAYIRPFEAKSINELLKLFLHREVAIGRGHSLLKSWPIWSIKDKKRHDREGEKSRQPVEEGEECCMTGSRLTLVHPYT